jgi:hypothetical protein
MAANHCLLAAALCAAAGLAMAQEQDKPCCAKNEAQGGPARTQTIEIIPSLSTTAPVARVAQAQRAQSEMEAARQFLTLRSAAQPEARSHSRTVMVHSEDGREYKVEINGDDVKAWIDGERVPQDRVKVGDKRISLKDESGKTVHNFNRAVTLAAPRAAQRPGHEIVIESDDPIVWETDGEVQVWPAGQPASDHPPVMIGINMGPLDDADEDAAELLEEHDLGAEDVVVVMGVIEGLPADNAGVEEGDLLVAIDGEWGVTTESLRDVLMNKKPGDSIKVVVIRDGDEEELKIKLAPYNPGRLGQNFADEAASGMNPFMFRWGEENEDVQKLLEKLQSQRGELDEEVKELVERLQHGELERFRQLDEMPRFRVYRDDGQAPRAMVTPAPPTPPSAPYYREALRDQEDRLARMEERLERIEDRLERVLEALEERARD